MVNAELELVLLSIVQTSCPDEALKTLKFSMINHLSGQIMGDLNLRVGYTDNIKFYRGNIGYAVSENYRGNNYSARACQLLVPMLKKMNFSPIWITCNTDNLASRRNIEKLGAVYMETIIVPEDYTHISYYRPEARAKFRFRWDIS